MSKIASILIKIKNVYLVFFASILLYLSIINIQKIEYKVYYIAGIVYVIGLLFLFILADKVNNKALFLIGIILISFLLRMIWILIANTRPVSDFYLVNRAAKLILEGSFSELKQIEYFNMWVYQLGFSSYCAFLYSVFSVNIFIVKLFNVFFSTGCVLLIYFISRKTFNEKAARISSLLYCIYIQSIIFNSLLTNQVISLFFIYLGLAVILYKPNIPGYILSGISMAVGHIFRPEGNFVLCIVVFAILIYGVFDILKDKNSLKDIKIKSLVPILSKTAILIICFNVFVQLFGYSLRAVGITDYEYKNRNVYWKFVVGLNPSTNGGYSYEDEKILNQYPIGESLYEKEMELIKERISNRKQLIRLMHRKFELMWSNNDYSINFISPGTNLNKKMINYMVKFEKIQYTLIMIMSFLAILFILIDRNKYDLSICILILLISSNWLIYLIIEIQTRYRYFIMPAFFILAGFGFKRIICRATHLKVRF